MSQEQRMAMLREVSLRADNFYKSAEELGRKAANALTDRKRAQITGLESTANSALKTTDVFDFIKFRLARQEEWRKKNWGEELLTFLSQNLYKDREVICKRLTIETESADGLEVHLLLIREFVRQLSAQYEYVCKFPQSVQEENSEANT